MKILLYCNGGSKNHGCEAITRTVVGILSDADIKIVSTTPEIEAEHKFGTSSLCEFKEFKLGGKFFLPEIIINKISRTIIGKNIIKPHYKKQFNEVYRDAQVCISLGGDNYCYGDASWIAYRNKELVENNKKLVLWGCSIEENVINRAEIKKDLQRYDLILARESLTYDALIKAGIHKNTKLVPDPAFTLAKTEVNLPELFIENNVVGINVSPLVQSLQNSENDIVLKNYINLIDFIIKETDMNVALIPHVVIEKNDDRTPLAVLYHHFKDTNRVMYINEDASLNAQELKYVISKCRFFVGARTHATIAAYSQQVPTLVLGYSIKALGIAKDIFGSHEDYVVPVQNLKLKNELIEAFKNIMNKEDEILKHYESFMPEYIEKVNSGKQIFLNCFRVESK